MTKRKLPSDPEFLLKFMDDIDSDGSDDDFDGYVDDDEQEMDVSDTYIHELGGVYMEVARGAGGSMEVPQVGGCYDVSGSGLDSAALEVAQVHGCNDVSGGGLDSAATVEDAFQSEVDVRSEEESSGEVSEGSEEQLKIPRFTEKCGVVKDLSGKQPVNYFLELFHDELQDYIVEESNRYGEQYITTHQAYLTQHPRARANAFVKKPFTRLQFRLFLSLIICMGIVNMPNIQSYWNTSWPFASNNFNEIMSRDRFLLYLKFLHLANNDRMIPLHQVGHDKLFKVRYFLSQLMESYQSSYRMERELSVDEMMIKYKGRLSFLQYMPKKPHKWGIKAWALAEAGSGYCWNLTVYTGKEESATEDALGTRVVVDLVKSLAGKGHHIYFDNYYTSPTLCHILHTNGFGCCGTLRLNRKGIPPSFRSAKVKKGEVVQYTDGEILGIKWKDKKDVSLLTTIHNGEMISKRRRLKGGPGGHVTVQKPAAIDQYNTYMGGVDRAGQLMQYYGYNNVTKKWWKRIFFHMLDVTLVNAYILYNKSNTGKLLSHMDFRIAVAKGLIASTGKEEQTCQSVVTNCPTRLIGHNHFPEPGGGKPDCRVCSNRAGGKRKQTSYRCKTCKVPLCIFPCFERYHTVVNF